MVPASRGPRRAHPSMFRGFRSRLDASLLSGSEDDEITTLADVVGSNDAVAASGQKPRLRLAHQAGKNCMEVESGDKMSVPKGLIEGLDEWTIFLVVKIPDAGGRSFFFCNHYTAVNEAVLEFYGHHTFSTPVDDIVVGNDDGESFVTAQGGNGDYDPTQYNILCFRMADGAPHEIWINGVEVSGYDSQGNGDAVPGSLTEDCAIGAFHGGASPLGSRFFWADMLFFDRKLGSHELGEVFGYLSYYWSIALA